MKGIAVKITIASTWLVVAAGLFTLSPGSFAQRRDVVHFGVGYEPCSRMERDPAFRPIGEPWIAGYWTANDENDHKRMNLGVSIDLVGLVRIVEDACRKRPIETLEAAVMDAEFLVMEREGWITRGAGQ